MIITHEFTMDFDRRGISPVVDAVQGDSNTRAVKVALTSGGVPFAPPAGVTASVAFRKPDGKRGWYDKLPDGTAACTTDGNTVTAVLAPEMLTAEGQVDAVIVLQDRDLNQLATFGFAVLVAKNPAAGITVSNDYYNYTTMEDINAALDGFFAKAEKDRVIFEEKIGEEQAAFLKTASDALDAVHEAATEDAPAIVCEETGNAINAEDASNRLLQGLTLYGKTTQVTTTGKNLFYVTSAAYNNDGTFNIDASASEKAGPSVDLTGKIPAGVYTLSYLNGSGSVFVMADANDYTVPVAIGTTKTFDYDGTSYLRVKGQNVPVGTIATYKIQLEPGNKASAFEPYTGGIPSPNPDYPQELVSAGNGGAINTTVCGGNLFDANIATKDYRVNSFNGEIEANGDWDASSYTPVKPETSYVLNFSYWSSAQYGMAFYDKDKSYISGQKQAHTAESNMNPFVFTTPANCAYIRFSIYKKVIDMAQVILNAGTTVIPYEPYKGQTLTASTPNGLPGVLVTSGGNYTDENGQQWVCDEKDYARGVYVQRIGVVDFSDNNTKILIRYGTATSGKYRFLLANTAITNPDGTNILIASLCNIATPTTAGNIWWNRDGVATYANGEFCIYIDEISQMTVTEAEAWMREKAVKVQYILETPIETPLSAEELAQYAALHTNKPSTTVYNDAEAGMKLAYVADTKAYIDKKFNELAAAIVNNA